MIKNLARNHDRHKILDHKQYHNQFTLKYNIKIAMIWFFYTRTKENSIWGKIKISGKSPELSRYSKQDVITYRLLFLNNCQLVMGC